MWHRSISEIWLLFFYWICTLRKYIRLWKTAVTLPRCVQIYWMIHQTKLTDILNPNKSKNCELKQWTGKNKSFLSIPFLGHPVVQLEFPRRSQTNKIESDWLNWPHQLIDCCVLASLVLTSRIEHESRVHWSFLLPGFISWRGTEAPRQLELCRDCRDGLWTLLFFLFSVSR